jgi:zinc D-Ala-D-Ala dipeptidase
VRKITDIGEPLIDIRTVPALGIDMSRTGVRQSPPTRFRFGLVSPGRLARAQACLPDGYQLQVKEAWRPIWVQEHLWRQSLDQLRTRRPGLTGEKLRRENARFTAPPGSAPPHSTGGAVDLVLLDHGEYADMGWRFNQPSEGSGAAYPVSAQARRNRDILAHAMDEAGFINYPAEWWHWSFGDRYWAFQTSHETALYGPQ